MKTIPANEALYNSVLVTFWYSADGQASIDMTDYTAAEALDALLEQCATKAERDAILAGRFGVE